MTGKEKRSQRYLDELDRRSPVNRSDAMRARDVSRPDASAIDEAGEPTTSSSARQSRSVSAGEGEQVSPPAH